MKSSRKKNLGRGQVFGFLFWTPEGGRRWFEQRVPNANCAAFARPKQKSEDLTAAPFMWIAIAVWLGLMSGCNEFDAATPEAAQRAAQESIESSPPIFTDITADRELGFRHRAVGARQYYFPAVMASGCAFIDIENDGDLDIALTNATGGAVPENRLSVGETGAKSALWLFRQEADGKFVDVTDSAGVTCEGYGMGLAVGDINNDGWPDLYLTCVGQDRLFVNRGGIFHEITREAGIDNPQWGASAAFLDYDRDGWLDLFVTNYVDYDPAQPCFASHGRPDFCNPAQFPRTSDKLFRNVSGDQGQHSNGNEIQPRFEDVSLATGIALKAGVGLGVACGDFTGDGWPDIYVANDGHANFLWVNQQGRTFVEEAVLYGVAYDTLGRGQGSMGVAVADVNDDLAPDLFVTNLEGENNALYLSSGTTFTEQSQAWGLGSSSFPLTGFGTACVDWDHDGDLDVIVVNGKVSRAVTTKTTPSIAAPGFWQDYAEDNRLYEQDTPGQFQELTSLSDAFLSRPGVARGLATGDIDNDGDLDLLVTYADGPARLLRNDLPNKGHWLQIRAIEPELGGRDAHGSAVTIRAGEFQRRQWLNPAASYLSSHAVRLHFGLGDHTIIDGIEVVWPDGQVEAFGGDAADQIVVLKRGGGVQP